MKTFVLPERVDRFPRGTLVEYVPGVIPQESGAWVVLRLPGGRLTIAGFEPALRLLVEGVVRRFDRLV